MKKIGLVSDTHGKLPAKVIELFHDTDLIIHAGDICDDLIIPELENIAEVIAVSGNMDSFTSSYPSTKIFKQFNYNFFVIHILNGEFSEKNKSFSNEIKTADIIVTGHRNPDMDSVCAAWCYAEFKNRIDTPYMNL